MDNKSQRNNLRLKGLKEGEEEGDLKGYLEKILTSYLAPRTETGVTLTFAHRIGIQGKGPNRSKDRDIMLGPPDNGVKTFVLDSLWEKPKLVEANQHLTVYTDLSPITLQRRQEWSFLISKLTRAKVAYTWRFPHMLLVEYKEKTVIIRTTAQAIKLEKEIII